MERILTKVWATLKTGCIVERRGLSIKLQETAFVPTQPLYIRDATSLGFGHSLYEAENGYWQSPLGIV